MEHRSAHASTAHVLVVDTDPLAAHFASAVLGGAGFRVSVAFGEDEAAALDLDDPIDVLAIDLDLPHGIGHATVRRLRDRRGVLAVVMTTDKALSDSLSATNDGRSGPMVLLRKPASPKDLIDAVSSVSPMFEAA